MALNTYGNYPRTWNLEHGLELQHELMPRLSMTGSWFHGDFHNLTTTINQSWKFDGDPLQNPNYIPYPIYNPLTGEPITVYGRTAAAAAAPTLNLDTFDPERKRIYNAYAMEFRARPGRGASLFGGFTFERQLDVNCTASDNPNSVFVSSTATSRDDFRFCDDRKNDIPFRRQFKLAGSYLLPWDVTLSASFQNVQGSTSSQNMAITRNSTRYPADCPSPCPAGAIILPASFQPATLTVQLVDQDTVYTERINQLDLKVSKTFKSRPGERVADPRGVQRQQLGRGDHLRVDQRARGLLPAAQQHPAGPHHRRRRECEVVGQALSWPDG